MADQTDTKNIKIIVTRPEGQKREYANYIETSATPRDISFRFCDLKPPRPEELEKIQKEGKVEVIATSEIVIPFDVIEEFSKNLEKQLDEIKKQFKKEENK